jgi:hypothetical protein
MAKNGLKWLKIAMQPRLRTVFSWEIISTRAQKEKFPGFVIIYMYIYNFFFSDNFFLDIFFKKIISHIFFSHKNDEKIAQKTAKISQKMIENCTKMIEIDEKTANFF